MSDVITIAQDGGVVLICIGGRAWPLPPEGGREIGRALLRASAQADEILNAESVALDAAIALKGGLGINLATNPDVRKEALNNVAWNTLVRKMPDGGFGNIKSREVFGDHVLREG